MLQETSNICKDPSVLRRLLFAAKNLHKDTPKYWDIVTKFGFKSSSESACREKIKVLLENIQFVDENAFNADQTLFKELSDQDGFQGHPLGIVLIPAKEFCGVCGEHMLVRDDRPSFPVIYTNMMGTVNGTHFRKYCSKHWKGCSFTQHYGFHQNGGDSEIEYDEDCLDLPYFLSTQMTAFETKLLHSLSAEILLAQISYKQRADIYNYTHGYDSVIKKGPNTSQISHEDDG